MTEQHPNSGDNRRRRGRASRRNNGGAAPVLIAARRPDSPLLQRGNRGNVAASAEPRNGNGKALAAAAPAELPSSTRSSIPPANGNGGSVVRRSARIVQHAAVELDDRERLRLRLLERLAGSDGRHVISKVADELWANGFDVPPEQGLQVQLLEHFDESRVRQAMTVLQDLVQKEPPLKRPVFEQRLRRLEEYAEEASTREAANALRRLVRT
jgi:hypothetical protein